MPQTYNYQVRDTQGKLLRGTLEGDTQVAVASKLRQMGYAPVSIADAKAGGLKMDVNLPFLNRVKIKDLAVFSRQFATMLNSGLSLLRGLAILEEQTDNKTLAGVVGDVRREVEGGESLSGALAHHPKTFNRLFISMTRAGEVGGFLDSVLIKLADNLEQDVALRSKIKSAMTYPIVVMSMVLMILAAMLLFIVPQFKNMYASMGGILPLPTRILLTISDAVKSNILYVVVAGIVFMFSFKRWIAKPAGRYALDAFKLKVPVFGPLFRKTALSRFSRTLGTLLKSGVPILQSLEIVSETVGNGVIGRAIRDVQDSVREGESLAGPLSKHDVFPPMVVQMMAVGEETGALDTMLAKIGDFYDREVEAAVEALTSMIEPLLIGVMGFCVGGMVIALYLPLFNIIKLIK